MAETLAGFDWDAGNRAKCQKHGVSVAQIEALFSAPLLLIPDAAHSKAETRLRALGKTSAGRMVFLVFTVRLKGGRRLIRPISARYMHAKEVASYEKENPQL
jgi:uncharacterized DUF497 family protein